MFSLYCSYYLYLIGNLKSQQFWPLFVYKRKDANRHLLAEMGAYKIMVATYFITRQQHRYSKYSEIFQTPVRFIYVRHSLLLVDSSTLFLVPVLSSAYNQAFLSFYFNALLAKTQQHEHLFITILVHYSNVSFSSATWVQIKHWTMMVFAYKKPQRITKKYYKGYFETPGWRWYPTVRRCLNLEWRQSTVVDL